MSLFKSEALRAMPAVGFDQDYTTEQTNEILSLSARILLDRLSAAGWERAGFDLLCYLNTGDFSGLCHYDPDVLDLQWDDQAVIYQVLAFFKKRKDLGDESAKEAAAYMKFVQAESDCAVTNATFRAWEQGRFQFRPLVERVLHDAQRIISDTLGEAPTLQQIRPRFGPGATTQTPKKNACVAVKLHTQVSCSANLAFSDLLSEYITEPWLGGGQAGVLAVQIAENKLSFAPKNAKIYRAVCTEPVLNGMLQNGLGDVITSRLRRVGIDISDQSRNQRAALYGSLSDESATLDLTSASDTKAYKLIEHLVSMDWMDLFRSTRSAIGFYSKEQRVFHYEKMSSMGNGFTFPLETLVFWALMQAVKNAVCPRHRIPVLAYGDDIVVPSACALQAMEVLRDLGFTPNMEKSFWSGSFRESCGRDYVHGINVRPVSQKDALKGADLFKLHNAFLAKGDYVLSEFFKQWIDPSLRHYGPQGFGDGHLVDPHWKPLARKDEMMGGYYFHSWAFKPNKLEEEIASLMAERHQNSMSSIYNRPGRHRRFTGYHHVIRVATYVQNQRESRQICLTKAEESVLPKDHHVYADKRMPDPQTSDDEKFFVVPGTGAVHLMKVYTFEPPLL